MENKIKKWMIIYVFVLSFFCGVALCMENTGNITDPQAAAIKIFLGNQINLPHKIIYALAAVNKSCEKLLLDTAPERGEYLLRKLGELPWVAIVPFAKPDFLNKYGSFACNKEDCKKFILDGHFLIDDDVLTAHGVWDNFSKRVTALPKPFLTPEGDLCCYGWGNNDDRMLWNMQQHLIRYCVMPDQRQTFFRCGVSIDGHDNYALSYFAALPNLLKVFVNCPVIKENDFMHIMLVALKDAIIPDNYKEYQESGNEFGDIKFDELPKALKNAIVARHKQCKEPTFIPILRVQAMEIVLRNGWLSHEIIRSLAISRRYKQLLLTAAQDTKRYLVMKAHEKYYFETQPFWFHQYGSAFGQKYRSTPIFQGKASTKLVLKHFYLAGEGGAFYAHIGFWEDFGDVASLPKPFFNAAGDFCCYGWGKQEFGMLWDQDKHVIEYSLSKYGATKSLRCGLNIGSIRNHYALSLFAALPNLLKACVNSSSAVDSTAGRLYELKDAIIPDNYDHYEPLGNIFLDTTFGDLPKELKEAIVERYQECKKLQAISQ